jgi:hypothetical protein
MPITIELNKERWRAGWEQKSERKMRIKEIQNEK